MIKKNQHEEGMPPPKPSRKEGERKVDYGAPPIKVVVLPFLFKDVRLENPCRYTTFIVTFIWFMQYCSLLFTSVLLFG